MNPEADYKAMIKTAVKDTATFIRLTLSNTNSAKYSPWVKIIVRPVRIKGHLMMQFSYQDPRKDVTKNYSLGEFEDHLDEVLDAPVEDVYIQTKNGDIQIRVTRKGRVLVTRTKPSPTKREANLSHDHAKAYLLSGDTANPMLQALGITNQQGGIRPGMQGKFKQINEFLRIVEQTLPSLAPEDRVLKMVDCGCGNAYLTFAAYYYLTFVRGLQVSMTGVDVNAELVESNEKLRDSLGWENMEFRASSIAEFEPETPPDVVLSLHACDTATDEAIARGILWGSKVILAAPCCQHELHNQLKSELFRPALRHGILRERLADVLTDAFRGLALRIMGYRTDIFQFVDPEHTAKNVMIRAESGIPPADKAAIREYQALKDFWNVTPAIEKLLGEPIQRLLTGERP